MRYFLGLLLASVVCALLVATSDPGRVSSATPIPPSQTPDQNLVAYSPTTDQATIFAQATMILATITAQAQSTIAHQTPLSTQQLQATQTAVQAFLPQLQLTQTAQQATGRQSCVPVPALLHSAEIGAL